jgi:hypothetical protein
VSGIPQEGREMIDMTKLFGLVGKGWGSPGDWIAPFWETLLSPTQWHHVNGATPPRDASHRFHGARD